jgi:hypothetical protein
MTKSSLTLGSYALNSSLKAFTILIYQLHMARSADRMTFVNHPAVNTLTAVRAYSFPHISPCHSITLPLRLTSYTLGNQTISFAHLSRDSGSEYEA